MTRSKDILRGPAANREPPYTRYALLNAVNLGALAAAAVTTLASGEAWIAVCAGAAEAVWLLLAPGSQLIRERVFDPRWAAARKAEAAAHLAEKMRAVSPGDQVRACALLEQRDRVERLACENPGFAAAMVRSELAKLEGLVGDFLDLGALAEQNERHLRSFDVAGMERAWSAYAAQVKAYPEGDSRRAVAMKNLDVLRRRSERHADVGRSVAVARGQMELIEHTFRLLADDIVTMDSPSLLGRRLDDLRIAVDAIRETVDEEAQIAGELSTPARVA